MDLIIFDPISLIHKGSEYSGELIGLIAASTTPLFNRLKVLRDYQFSIPSIFNLFAFLFVVPVYLYAWTSQPSVGLYKNFPLFATIGVIFILASFFNGFCFKKTRISTSLRVGLMGISLITYAFGICMIVFSINVFFKLNNYYVFSGKVVSEKESSAAENRQVSLLIGGSQKGRLSTTTDKKGEYLFFLSRSQICFLNKVELIDQDGKSKKFQIIDLWPGLDPTCINNTDSNFDSQTPKSSPEKSYQFQEDIKI